MQILQKEDELKNIVKLVGPEALPDRQRLVLETARIIKVAFLQQDALDTVDTYCSPVKQSKMLKIIISFHELAERVINKGAPVFKIRELAVLPEILRMKNSVPNDRVELLDDLSQKIQAQFSELEERVA
jgi:V/A-type H+-transporting ATPase subunit A